MCHYAACIRLRLPDAYYACAYRLQVRHVLQPQLAVQLQQHDAATQQAQPSAPAAQAAALSLQPQGGWMGQCCSDRRLQEIYMPGGAGQLLVKPAHPLTRYL
jgi:hypothetical protein